MRIRNELTRLGRPGGFALYRSRTSRTLAGSRDRIRGAGAAVHVYGDGPSYRGYDILDFAETSEFEEIAHLLVHGDLPTAPQLAAYKAKLKYLRGLPQSVKAALETVPAATHPMDVMRSGVSALGCALPEPHDHSLPDARDIADRLMASLGSMLLYWRHFAHHGRRIEVETDDDSIGGHFLHLLRL